jgi:hypothetical protein
LEDFGVMKVIIVKTNGYCQMSTEHSSTLLRSLIQRLSVNEVYRPMGRMEHISSIRPIGLISPTLTQTL